MNSSAKSIQVFGAYIVGLGLVLLVVPNLLLQAFGFEPTSEPWIRVLGIVVAALGYYYLIAAKSKATAFFAATVHGRVWLLLAFIALVFFGLAKPTLILFGTVDFAGAVWTWKALRSEAQA
jgi:hypothetical protein